MKSFTDSNGKDWTVAINVTSVKRVRDKLDIDLLDLSEALFKRLLTDPVTLVDVLYVVCETQANDRQITDEQFGEAMVGDAIDKGTTALLESLAEFFPKAKRAVLQRAVQKIQQVEEMAGQVAMERFESATTDAELHRLIHGASSTSLAV